MQKSARILVVTHRCGDYEKLASLLETSPSWEPQCARGVAEARRMIGPSTGVILCESALPDGTWRDVVAAVGSAPDAPRVIVMSRAADDALWSDVLEGGAYDLMPFPCDARELFRSVTFAWNRWSARQHAHTAA